jgi:hypothetical protein
VSPATAQGLVVELQPEGGELFGGAARGARGAFGHRRAVGGAWDGESYIETLHLSKAGLLDQMASKYGSQFEEADAKWAIDQIFGE